MKKDLPIRLKVGLIEKLKELIVKLHEKNNDAIDRVVEEIKKHALLLEEEEIQGGVLRFVESVQFQERYDPVVTRYIQEQADRLIEHLGFMPPRHG